ncbi:MAG: poly-gamma-glutamate system protein [Leptospira sp.]|jgi:poly-gamma-glutamate system protein|nr:poly-gamma-glutamate system protein [Leptospira sp.]NCS92439.1 poly-gamma-glutamate system protein [Leptospira sp.]
MIKVYWKTPLRERAPIVLVAVLSILLYLAVEEFQVTREQPYFKEKLLASKLTEKAYKRIKKESILKNHMANSTFDPNQTGLIGLSISEVTSNVGYLSSKQTSINPNFSAVAIHLLKKAKLKQGDTVAVALSGSFPAINIAVYSAIQTLKLQPIVITSSASSQWGANHHDFLWLDMEDLLFKDGILNIKSKYATLGGVEDKALGMSERSKDLLLKSITRNKIQIYDFKNFKDGIDKRVEIYNTNAKTTIKAYINVGGGSLSVGTSIGKKTFKPGLIKSVPLDTENIDSVMLRFLKNDIPVIHFIQIESLAKKYNLPTTNKKNPIPGEGNIFRKKEYNLWLISVGLILIISLLVFVKRKSINETELII